MTTNSLTTCCESTGRSIADSGVAASGQTPVYCPVYESRLLATARHELSSAAALGVYGSPYTGGQGYGNYVTYGTDASAFYSLVSHFIWFLLALINGAAGCRGSSQAHLFLVLCSTPRNTCTWFILISPWTANFSLVTEKHFQQGEIRSVSWVRVYLDTNHFSGIKQTKSVKFILRQAGLHWNRVDSYKLWIYIFIKELQCC